MEGPYKYIIISIILTVSSQTLVKHSMKNISFDFSNILLSFINAISPILILGLFLAFLASFTFIKALSKSDLSTTFPIINSINFLLVTLLSWYVLKEHVSLLRGAGIGLICLGAFLITRSDKK